MNERSLLIAEALGHWLLAWTLVVLAVGSGMRVLRPRRAAVRYGGWLLATFAGVALLPMVAWVGPRASWNELLSALRPIRAVPAPEDSSPSFRSWFADRTPDFRPVELPGMDEPAWLDRAPSSIDGRPATSPTVPAAAPGSAGDRWLWLGLGLWSAGFLAFAARLAWSGWRVRALLARLDFAVSGDLEDQKERVRRELGIRRRVRIGTHPEIAAPLCVGWFRPVILWPVDANCPMTPRERRASLVHELAHLRHGDDAIALLAELWRALAWFFPPIHLTLRFLQREREYRCDDVAAQALDSPEDYALWLLDLAPVSVGSPPPPLAASLLGRTSLAGRVTRILRGDTRWARPLGRSRRAVLVLLAALVLILSGSVRLIGFAGRAQAAGPDDAPLPQVTPKELAARIRESMKAYDNKGVFRVLFTETRDTNWRGDQKPILVTFHGRARYDSDGRLWRAEYDAMTTSSGSTQLRPDRWSTGFDGVQLYERQVSLQDQLTLGQANISADQWTPRSVFWNQGEALIQVLEETDRGKFSLAIEQRVVEGTNCYVVKAGNPAADWGSETVVSPRQGYLPIRRINTWKGNPSATYELHDIHEAAPGLWAPGRIDYESLKYGKDGTPAIDLRRRIRVAAYQPGAVVPPATFAIEVPYDADVVDRRTGLAYHNDPWWPELRGMLREKYDWPKCDLSPLRNLGSPSRKKLENQPAPPLQVSRWLNSPPRDLAALRGKVVLVEFWNMADSFHRPLVPALRQLYAAYHPAGLEMIAIHGPTDDPEALRRFIDEFGITYPVAIDAKGSQAWGATVDSYGAQGHTCAFLIDREGKVHSVGTEMVNGGQIIETLIPLLKSAGAADVQPISRDPLLVSQLPTDAYKACERLFNEKAKAAIEANPTGRIRCRIVDGQGHPIVGAKVQATLQLTILIFATPGGYYAAHYGPPLDRFGGTTGPDGQLELNGLCKGVYMLKAESPGKAWAERKAILTPALDPVEVAFVLDQGGAIAGRVRDDAGEPIVGATVHREQRHHYEQGELRYSTGPRLDSVKTDAAGRFQFSGIQEGRYTFKIEAPGFESVETAHIPAGIKDVTITLKRSVAP
jgi:beta-lactamase regulating signal transducer with metallopeptidase domain/peroxiredoxin